jgi:hypothetical protein
LISPKNPFDKFLYRNFGRLWVGLLVVGVALSATLKDDKARIIFSFMTPAMLMFVYLNFKLYGIPQIKTSYKKHRFFAMLFVVSFYLLVFIFLGTVINEFIKAWFK